MLLRKSRILKSLIQRDPVSNVFMCLGSIVMSFSDIHVSKVGSEKFHLKGYLKGPDDTPYSGGSFVVDIVLFGLNYAPFSSLLGSSRRIPFCCS